MKINGRLQLLKDIMALRRDHTGLYKFPQVIVKVKNLQCDGIYALPAGKETRRCYMFERDGDTVNYIGIGKE